MADSSYHDDGLIWQDYINGAVITDAKLVVTSKLPSKRLRCNGIEVECEPIQPL